MNEITGALSAQTRSPFTPAGQRCGQSEILPQAHAGDSFATSEPTVLLVSPAMLSGTHPAEEGATPARMSFLAAGALALAMAAPMLAPSMPVQAAAAPVTISTQVATSTGDTRQANATARRTTPVTEGQEAVMERVAAGTETDSETAQEVRDLYHDRMRDVREEARTFSEATTRIDREVRKLDEGSSDLKAGATVNRNGFSITVEEDSGRTKVVALSRGVTIESVREGDHRTVTIRTGRNEERLEETPATRTLVSGQTKRTLHVADQEQYGFRTGDFEVTRRESPNRQVRLFVRGASIQSEVRETVHGFAGDIRQTRRDSWTVPDATIQPERHLDLEYSQKTDLLDEVTGQVSQRTRDVGVYSDGSTVENVSDAQGDRQGVVPQSMPPSGAASDPGQG